MGRTRHADGEGGHGGGWRCCRRLRALRCARARARRGAEDVDATERCDWPARLSARNRPSSSSQSARISEQKISDIKIGSKRETHPTVTWRYAIM